MRSIKEEQAFEKRECKRSWEQYRGTLYPDTDNLICTETDYVDYNQQT